jgi:hypothetical protein
LLPPAFSLAQMKLVFTKGYRRPRESGQGCPGKILRRPREGNRLPNFVLAGLGPAIHALGAVETKTWMRGSGPRKTTVNRFLGVRYTLSLQQ